MDIKEKAFFEAIVSYIPQSIVEDRILDPRLPEVHGQFRYGTLVFADISGFTAMSEKLSKLGKEGAEELTNILNRYFTKMLDIAFSYQGIQLKFGGDAMLLLFLGHQHAARAVRCSLKMQEAMKGFSKVSTSQGVFQLKMSIGINTGEFFEASLGLPKERLYYIFTGREINRTAEVEGVAKADEIFIGAATLSDLGSKVVISREREGCYQVERLLARVRGAMPPDLEFKEERPGTVIETLATYLPQRLVERISANPTRAGIEGEHRRVTVMFVNFLGSTELVSAYGKERQSEITQILNDYFVMVHKTVNKYGGVVVGCDLNNKGDKLLVFFGAPIAHENDDELTVRCALEMKQLLADMKLPLQQRVGINTGYVFSGEVGSPLRKEFTVMGDDVNLAARLMGVAQFGQILVSHSTYSKITNKFLWQDQAPVKVKGKTQPVVLYQVDGVRDKEGLHHEIGASGLVGREREVAKLKEVVDIASAGSRHVLDIIGPAGIGKSRLIAELKLLWTKRGFLTYVGNCQSYGTNTPYLPWIDMFSSFFNLRESDTSEQKRFKIETMMLDLCPKLKDWTAVMGNLMHVPIPESNLLKSLDPKLRHQRLLDVVLELVQVQARRNPLLLVFEDSYWADEMSVELLNYVARSAREYPLLICLVYRPEKRLRLKDVGGDGCTEMILGELSARSNLELVRSMLNVEEIPQELSQLIMTKSQGNPLFTEEVVRSLIDTGQLKQDCDTGEYKLDVNLRPMDVPDTIQGVIMARLDQLPEDTRSVLRVASVIGRVFDHSLVKAIYPHTISDMELRERLRELATLGLTQLKEDNPLPEYSFKHILTQEVAYDTLLFALRRDLHHKIGHYYEERYPRNLEEHYELLFYHYDRTKDKGKALEYSVRSGNKVKGMFANQEAVKYYQRSLEIAVDSPESTGGLRSKVQESLGDIYELTGKYDQSLESYQVSRQWSEGLKTGTGRRRHKEALSLSFFPDSPDPQDTGQYLPVLYRKISVVYERKGQYETALEWLDKGLTLLEQQNKEKAHLCTARAGVLYRRGEYDKALDWCQRGLDIARVMTDLDGMAHGYYLLGTIHTDLGNVSKAIDHRHQSLDIYEEIKSLPGQAKVHNNLGVDYYYQGNWEKAKEHYNKSLEIREKIGDINGIATVSNNLGEVLSDQGYLEEAIESFRRCLTTWERMGHSLGVGLSNSNLGKAYRRQGDYHKALDHLGKARQIFEQLKATFLSEVYQRLAETCLGLGQMESALDWCKKSLDLAREQKANVVEGVTLRIMAQVYGSQRDWSKATELMADSQTILRKLDIPYELGQTLWQLALLYHDMVETRQQKDLAIKIRQPLEESIMIFDKLGVKVDTAKAAVLKKSYEAG